MKTSEKIAQRIKNNPVLHAFMTSDRRRAALALVSCSLVFIAVLSVVVYCLLAEPTEDIPERGRQTFHLFTVCSNLMSALGCGLSIPFAVEGLRKGKYDIPEWCITLLFAGATSVCVTFVFACLFIWPVMGTYRAWGAGNFWLHLVCPILCVCAFLFLQTTHRMKRKNVLIALIPFTIYACVYFYNVVVLGIDGGGWRDIYRLNTAVPFYLSIPLMVFLAFTLSSVMALVHNVISSKQAARDEAIRIGLALNEDTQNLDSWIDALATRHAAKGYDTAIVVPTSSLRLLKSRFKSDITEEDLCHRYLTSFMAAAQLHKKAVAPAAVDKVDVEA